MEMRRVTNVGEEPLVDAYDGTHYWIEPGNSAVVPREAVDLWFGDNDLIDGPHRRPRNEELNRLRIRYGANDDEALWEQNQPRVKVATLDGDECETVLSDPTGDKVTPASDTVDEKRELWELIETQRRELASLQREFQRTQRAEDAIADGELEEDQPVTPTSRKARQRT